MVKKMTRPATATPDRELDSQLLRRVIVEGVTHELSTGDSFYLASNVSHGVETLAATRVLDTFSPPRTDYLAVDEKVLHGAL